MKTKKDIIKDLKDVRYYYANRKDFDNAAKSISESTVIKKAEYYNELIKNAPPKLFNMYLAFVINNNSQATVADDWGFCIENIKYYCSKMYDYLLQEAKKSES